VSDITQHITIQINMLRPESEAERIMRGAQAWAKFVEKMAENKIAREKAAGNPLFQNIDNWDQYIKACELNEKRKRKELGFWRYHFGK
jgi:hypothetical protein